MEYLPLFIAGSIIGLILLTILIIAGGLFIIFPILGLVTLVILGFNHWILSLFTLAAVIYAISTINPYLEEVIWNGYKPSELVRINFFSSIIIVGLFITALVIK